MAREVKLTDQVLLGLARTVTFRSRFKEFKALYENLGTRGCGRCKKRRRQSGILPALKQAIVKNSGLIQSIKKHLKARALIVFVKEGKSVVKKVL
jgi:hypothetical protein